MPNTCKSNDSAFGFRMSDIRCYHELMDVSDLRVYQDSLRAFLVVEEIAAEMSGDLADVRKQVLRSAKSIPALLAEGFARRASQREMRRYTIQAMGSSDETVTHLRIIAISRYNRVPITRLESCAELYKTISKQLNSLATKIASEI